MVICKGFGIQDQLADGEVRVFHIHGVNYFAYLQFIRVIFISGCSDI